jgi:hypothetical protein
MWLSAISTTLCFLAVETLGDLEICEDCSVSLVISSLAGRLFMGRNLVMSGNGVLHAGEGLSIKGK